MIDFAAEIAGLDPLAVQREHGFQRSESDVDPIARLFDPAWAAWREEGIFWEYEHSHVGPLPRKLHPKQLDQLRAQARVRSLFWGNQTGKTITGALDCIMLALGRHPWRQYWEPPITQWASALTWELWEKILLPELLTWIPPDRVIDAPAPFRMSSKRDIVVLADNGKRSRITGKAAEQGSERYQGARVHQVWLDEEHPEEVFDEIHPRLVRFGGSILQTMTPLKGYTWVHRRVYLPWKQGRIAA